MNEKEIEKEFEKKEEKIEKKSKKKYKKNNKKKNSEFNFAGNETTSILLLAGVGLGAYLFLNQKKDDQIIAESKPKIIEKIVEPKIKPAV